MVSGTQKAALQNGGVLERGFLVPYIEVMSMEMDQLPGGVLRWEDPPPTEHTTAGPRRLNWQLMSLQLRCRPGEWAVLDEGPKSHLAQCRINGGLVRWWLPAGSFKARMRTIRGVKTLYACYVGKSEESAVAGGAAVDRADDDAGAGVGRVDHLPAAERDRDVA